MTNLIEEAHEAADELLRELDRLVVDVLGRDRGDFDTSAMVRQVPVPAATGDPVHDLELALVWRLRRITAYVAGHADEAEG